jgi:hypothetical protein
LGENNFSSWCSTSALYSVCPLLFEGKYTDYGAVSDLSGCIDLILSSLKSQVIEMDVGENEYHDIAIKRDTFDEKMIFTASNKNRLFVAHHWNKNKAISLHPVIIHGSVYREILDKYIADSDDTFQDIVDKIPSFVLKIRQHIEKKDVIGHHLDVETIWSWEEQQTNIAARWISRHSGLEGEYTSLLINKEKILMDYIKAGDWGSVETLYIEILKVSFLNNFMYATRKMWTPQCGAGNSNGELYPYEFLAKTILDISAAERKREEDW